MSGLPETVKGYLRRRGWERRAREAAVHVIWEQVVGEQIADHTETIFCRDGKLVVTASDPSWAHAISALRHQLATKLNDALGEPTIRDIHLQSKGLGVATRGSAPVRRRDLQFAGGMRVTDEELEAIPIGPEAQMRIERIVGGLRHPELRDMVRSALRRESRISAWKRAHGYRECSRCGALHNDPHDLCGSCRIIPR